MTGVDTSSANATVHLSAISYAGYVFTGWVDSATGEYIAPDETEYTLEGNGASFTALWKKVDFSDASATPYDISALPAGTRHEKKIRDFPLPVEDTLLANSCPILPAHP